MLTNHQQTHRRPAPIVGLSIIIALIAQFGALSSARAQGAPQITSCSPARGATDVSPSLKEITVTFDRDMEEGMSWTGGGPEFPTVPEGKRGYWRDKRTCVLPVQLESGHRYRVGINSTSHRNFRSSAGVPALTSSIWFTTSGTPVAPKRQTEAPKIVSMTPANGAQDVSPSLKELRVTFNMPMGGGFSWTGSGPEYPTVPEGKGASWTEDHKTCVLPVELQPNQQYRLGLNSRSFKNFRSAQGVPLVPVVYTFKTGSQ